jgi:hypothetical protein
MALSGTIQKVFSTGFTLKTEWSASQNVSDNYSTVTCTHKLVCASGYGLYISGRTNSCIVGGVSKSFTSAAISTAGGTTITLGTTTHKINHNADGTASVSLSTTFNPKATIAGKTVNSVTASGTITLNTIPRASSVTCNSFNIGDSTTITINRASSSFTHTIKFIFGNFSGTIAEKTSETTIGWTADAARFYAQMPSSTSKEGTITCETYSSSTLVGTTQTSFTAYAKQSDCTPTISATITDTNSGTSGATGNSNKIVKYISKPKVTITATAKNSASITSYRISWGDGQVSTSSSATFSNGVTSPTVTITATDSRGYVATPVTYNLSTLNRWVEYMYPTITTMTASRTESTSETATLTVKANYFNGNFGASSNNGTFSYRYRESGGTWGSWTLLATVTSGNSITGTATLDNLSTEKSYDFQAKLSDYFNTSDTLERTVAKSTGILRVADSYVRVNGDILDRYKTKLTNGLAQYLSSNIDPNTTLEELILTQANTPTSAFWYVRTMFFKEKSAVARRTQIAYPYAYDAQWVEKRIFTRVYIEGTGWTSWKAIGEDTQTTANFVGQSLVGSNLSIEWATVVITPSAANAPTPQRIYFNKTYEKAPIVLPVALTSSPGVEVKGVSVVGITTGYASLSVTRATTAATTLHFVVIGKAV